MYLYFEKLTYRALSQGYIYKVRFRGIVKSRQLRGERAGRRIVNNAATAACALL